MRPDPRLQEYILNEQPEELILLHEEYIHYNLIVHRSHNAFKNTVLKKPMEKDHKEQNQTIFGDVLNSQVINNSKSWAQITEAFRPGMFEEPKESPIVENVKDIIIPEVTPSCSEGE